MRRGTTKHSAGLERPGFIGVGVQVPLTEEELDAVLQASLFYHF